MNSTIWFFKVITLVIGLTSFTMCLRTLRKIEVGRNFLLFCLLSIIKFNFTII